MLWQRKSEPWTYTKLNEADKTWLMNVIRNPVLALEIGKLRTLTEQLVKCDYAR